MESDSDRCWAAAEDRCDFIMRETVPCEQPQDLSVTFWKWREDSGYHGRVRTRDIGIRPRSRTFRRRDHPIVQLQPPLIPPVVVGQDPSSDAVEPRTSEVSRRDIVEPSPSNGERLSHHIESIVGVVGSSSGVRKDQSRK